MDESTHIPKKIIYDNHTFILTSNNPINRKKIYIKVYYGEELKIKHLNLFVFVIL